ncbi:MULTISPECIES: thiolase [Sphingomonadaceae]|uniref:Acetyl-CoA acetyltransferase n=1 Tax=Stakelama pacifica TaxID=517720 RepID=A0A4R6G0H6_9SPHN|nr:MULTISPECIES: thiolase [Sphingomonadaceae]MDC7810804.1 thiolase [Sphingomonas koreensis]TDN86955.1 acetyl-CoA acetyltransferase [Stakelama pacifica]GGO91167.1 thiolase [Stakelama pacifica]
MSHSIRGKTAIVGMGVAGVGEAPGYSAMELLGLSVHSALSDAGLKLRDIDAVFAATSSHAFASMSVTEYLGLKPKYFDSTNVGGSSFEMHLLQASLALDAELCDVALICYGSNQRTAGGRLVSMSEPQWHETSYAPRHPITAYALATSRHMHQYGTTREMLADVAVSARHWANLNPDAFARGPLTRDDVLSMRMVSDPLTAGDCCLVTDGAAACILVRSDRARDFPKKPVYFLGAAGANWHRSIQAMPDLTVTAASESGPRAFEMAGLARSEVDLVMLYDAFTINTILFLEDLGFCPKGEGGHFVQDGRIAPGGELAVNTNGGGLSCVHPGMYGMFLIAEGVAQIRGEAGERQLKTADVALLHGNGGTLSSQVTAFLGSEVVL